MCYICPYIEHMIIIFSFIVNIYLTGFFLSIEMGFAITVLHDFGLPLM